MKFVSQLSLLALTAPRAASASGAKGGGGSGDAATSGSSPVSKVLSMLGELQAKVIKEGEVAQSEYAEFAEWCEDQSRNLGFETKTGNSEAERLQAKIAKESATLGTLNTKVDDTAASIATDEADLKAATWIRKREAADFAAEEKELTEVLSMLERAIAIIEREMKKGGAALVQMKTEASLGEVFQSMVRASMIGAPDAAKLSAFVQDQQKSQDSDDDEQEPGAPASAAYESQSGGVLDTLQDLQDKAESQLSDLRQRETKSLQHFELIKQELQNEIKYSNADLDEAKKGISGANERRATAKGELDVTKKNVAEDKKARGILHQDCMSKAAAFEAETKSRGEELSALAAAKKMIQEATSSASAAASFVQVASKSTSRAARFEVVRLVRDLGAAQHSMALVQLAGKMSSAMQSGDAFEKVKGLITDMIAKLEAEAGADATKKAYCDKELSETHEKKDDKTDEIEKLSTRIDQMSAKSSQLKQEIGALQMQLVKIAQSQALMDKLRREENEAHQATRADLEKGLTGVKGALKVLGEYYGASDKAHNAAEGAASGIIGLLEVIEADYSKNLAEVIADEEQSAANHDKMTKENEIERTVKVQDVKYKLGETKALDKTSGELIADRSGVKNELQAVMDYLKNIENECIAKAETYEERSRRRDAEIAGLKQALDTLENETAFLQKRVAHRTLRGVVGQLSLK